MEILNESVVLVDMGHMSEPQVLGRCRPLTRVLLGDV